MPSAARILRQLLERQGPIVAVGAHNALSAVLVEGAGFDAVWASGFEISASHAVPDANILTMSEQLQAAKGMARRVGIPVIADCDNGFGNAINVIQTVRAYEADGIAGICIEDNVFPKRCSLYAGVRRNLVSLEEHASKIRAACEARHDEDFVIIARTEAYVAGFGIAEACRRAEAYADAGADMILLHSKAEDFRELESFAADWDRPQPLVAVPTIYSHVSVDELAAAGFKLVIFANHLIRTGIKAMQETLNLLGSARRAQAVDDRVCPLEEVYELIGVPELKRNEAKYLPTDADESTEDTSAKPGLG